MCEFTRTVNITVLEYYQTATFPSKYFSIAPTSRKSIHVQMNARMVYTSFKYK